MDSKYFDALTRTLTEAWSRRGVLGLLAALPIIGGLLALGGETDAKKKRKKKCKSPAQVCAGKCGRVTYKCKKRRKTVDCGSCACDPPCDECSLCNEVTGACKPDPQQQGEPCGKPGQVCQADGTCACASSSCAPGTACVGGTCESCGLPGEPCCTGATCDQDLTACIAGTCQFCGDSGAPCCADDICDFGTVCLDATCEVCGSEGLPCCADDACFEGTCTAGQCQ